MRIAFVVSGESEETLALQEQLEERGHRTHASSRADVVMTHDPDVLVLTATLSDSTRKKAEEYALAAKVPLVLFAERADGIPDDIGSFDDLLTPDSPAVMRRLTNLARLHGLQVQAKQDIRQTIDFRDDVATWRALVDGAPNVIMRLDESGVVHYANRPIVGDGDPRAEHYTDVFGGEVGPEFVAAFHDAVDSGTSSQKQLMVDTPEGERVYLVHIGPVIDRSGGITGASLVVSDITQQHRSTEMNRRYIRRLNVLQEHLPLVMYEGVILEKSGIRLAEFRLHGSHEQIELNDEATYDDWMGCIHADDWERYHDALRSVGTGETSSWTVEYRWRTGSNDWIWMLDRGVRIETKQPRVVGFALDISDRKNLETQLAHAQKMEAVGRLAGGVAHDFNNLLTSIINFTWYVRDELPEESPLRGELSEVLTAAESGAQLTGRLLAFSKRRPVEPETVELNDRLTTVHKVLRRTLGENIEVVVKPAESPVNVVIDPGQFDQLLFNLAVNARDAMPDGGEICFQLLVGEQHAVLEITDTGVGIPEEELDQVFDPFFTTKGEEGTGLGLATCYGIASQANGVIEVESEPGEGSKFTVRLPLADNHSLPVTREYEPVPSVDEGTVALVVEDQPAILETVTRTLEKVGYVVQGATTAEEALGLVDDGAVVPEVVVTDVVLPRLSGPKMADRLREKYPELRVVLMSGYLGEEYESVAKKAPHTVFLAKPFTPTELLARLAVLTGSE